MSNAALHRKIALDFPGMGHEQFMDEYWRKKPLHLKGAAPHLLGMTIEQSRFEDAGQKLKRLRPDRCTRRPDGTLFLQTIDLVDLELAQLVDRFAEAPVCPSVWVDGVRAVDGSGIGAHYDHSDNFVLQQSGTKLWRLHDPSLFPQDELRRRMLHDPTVGASWLPDTALEFVVEASDLLYIPLFYTHWGVSVGPSLSISIVYNAKNPLELLLPQLQTTLSKSDLWWAPVAAQTQGDEKALAAKLASTLQSPQLQKELVQTWTETLKTPQAIPRWTPPETSKTYAAAQTRPTAAVEFPQIPRLRNAPLPPVGPEDVILPLDPEASAERLLLHRLRPALERLQFTADHCHAVVDAVGLGDRVEACFGLLAQLDDQAFAEALVRPEIFSWLWRATDLLEAPYPARTKAVFAALPRLVLPLAIQHRRTATLKVQCEAEGLNLLALGERWTTDAPPNEIDFVCARTSVDVPSVASDWTKTRLPRAVDAEHGPILLEDDPWLLPEYPHPNRYLVCPPETTSSHTLNERLLPIAQSLAERRPQLLRQPLLAIIGTQSQDVGVPNVSPEHPGLLGISNSTRAAATVGDLAVARLFDLLGTQEVWTSPAFTRVSCPLLGQSLRQQDALAVAVKTVHIADFEKESPSDVSLDVRTVQAGLDALEADTGFAALGAELLQALRARL